MIFAETAYATTTTGMLGTDVSTSTLETFLSNVFGDGLDMILYALETIWPYLILVAIVFMFWRIGKKFFKA